MGLVGAEIVDGIKNDAGRLEQLLIDDVLDELAFGIIGGIADARGHLRRFVKKLVRYKPAQVFVPGAEQVTPHRFRHEVEIVALPFHPQPVHVAPYVGLVADIAVNVETRDKRIIDPLEQRVVDDPQGLRQLTQRPFVDRGAVEMAVNGQQRCIVCFIPLPDRVIAQPVRVNERIEGLSSLIVRDRILDVLVAEQAVSGKTTPQLGRKGKLLLVEIEEVRVTETQIVFWVQEHDPEVVVDDIERDLSLADGPADESAHDVFGMVQQEAVTHRCRDLGVGAERIGGTAGVVVHDVGRLVPRRFDKGLLYPFQRFGIKRKHHVGFMHDGRMYLAETVIKRAGTRIIVRAKRRNDVDGLGCGRPRTHQLVKLAVRAAKTDMGKKKVFIEVARRHDMLGVTRIKEAFPGVDPMLRRRRRGRQLHLLRRGRPLCALLEPLGDRIELPRAHRRKSVGHPPLGVFVQESLQLGMVLRTGLHVCFGTVFAGSMRSLALRFEQADHRRVVKAPLRAVLRDGVKPVFPVPGLCRIGVDEQPGGIGGRKALGIVNHYLRGPAFHPFEGAEFELAGCVVAGVADDAAAVQDGFDVPQVVDVPLRLGHGDGRHRLRSTPAERQKHQKKCCGRQITHAFLLFLIALSLT